MSATYLSSAAHNLIDMAQLVIDKHIAGGGGTWCNYCRLPSPCTPVLQAQMTMARYHKLPRRTPRATWPDPAATPQRFAWVKVEVQRG